MERVYFLIKDSTVLNIIYDIRIIKSLFGWMVVGIPKPAEPQFRELVKGKHYLLDELTGSVGFLSFGEIRPYTKVLKQTYEDGRIAVQSEGLMNDLAENVGAGVEVGLDNTSISVTTEKIKVEMTEARTKAIMDAMIILAKAIIEDEFDKRFTQLNACSNMESLAFELQYEEAKKYFEDKTSDLPLLKALSESREITIEDLAQNILDGRSKFKKKMTDLLSEMYSLKDKFKKSSSIRDLNRLYEDYFGICMPEQQAIEEGRVVDNIRVIPAPFGLQF